MEKQNKKKTDKQDIDIELESLIKQNENLATGMKKIINSINNNKNTNKNSKL